MPVAWMWPIGSGQIHTSSHAGGIARATIRSITSGSVTRLPSSSRYSKPMPRRRRRSPGPEQSTFRSLATDPWSPARLALNLAASGEHVLEQLGRGGGVAARAHAEVEARGERVRPDVRKRERGAGLARDQLPGGHVDRACGAKAEHRVVAPGR